MNRTEFEQGRRVRLLVTIDGGAYQAGATGYLNQWYHSGETREDDWGVVFDQDGLGVVFDQDGLGVHTVIRGTLDSGESVLLTDIVEPIMPIADELSDATQRLSAVVYSWDDLSEQHQAAVR